MQNSSISGCDFATTHMLAKSEQSSFSSTTFSLILTFSVFVVLFHVFNFPFYMRDHMLHSFDLILSSTKRHNIMFPITDCWQRSSFTFSGMISLVTRLKRSSLSSEKGFVTRLMQSTRCSMFFLDGYGRKWWRRDVFASNMVCKFLSLLNFYFRF